MKGEAKIVWTASDGTTTPLVIKGDTFVMQNWADGRGRIVAYREGRLVEAVHAHRVELVHVVIKGKP